MNEETLYTPQRIKELRKSLELSQEAMADRLSVSFASVNRWENGQTTPSKLAKVQIDALYNEARKHISQKNTPKGGAQ